jgi:hypothetical protein
MLLTAAPHRPYCSTKTLYRLFNGVCLTAQEKPALPGSTNMDLERLRWPDILETVWGVSVREDRS